MAKNKMSRRNFIKLAGLAAVAAPASQLHAISAEGEVVSSKSAYGGFMARRHTKDNPPYQIDNSRYRRYDQKNEGFSRWLWDKDFIKTIKYADPVEVIKQNKIGYRREDYAFKEAAWTVGNTLGTMNGTHGGYHSGLYSMEKLGDTTAPLNNLPPWKPDDLSPEEVTGIVKKAALFYGASLVGITKLDERWVYSRYYDTGDNENSGRGRNGDIVFEDVPAPLVKGDGTMVIPKSMKYVIAMAFEMDEDAFGTYPGGPGSAATGNGYSRMAFTASSLAEFLRNLGYKALPCGNNTALSIPIAIDAGLGELGRLGLLMTPKYGPRVRLAKVITDMPLVLDAPISFGVTEFCENCGKCAKVCPSKAISLGKRTAEPNDMSNNPGVLKWPIHATKCYQYWKESGMDCGLCIRSCTFNKPYSWSHDLTRVFVGLRIGAIGTVMTKLDDAAGYGEQQNPRDYWKKNNFVHIKKL